MAQQELKQGPEQGFTVEDSVFLLGHMIEHRQMWEAANILHQLDKARNMPLLSDRVERIDPHNTIIHVVTPEDKDKLVEGVGTQRFYHEGYFTIPEQIRLSLGEDESYEAWLTFYQSDDQSFPLCEKLEAGMIERDNAGTSAGVYLLKQESESFREIPVKPESVHALYYSALEELNRVIEERKAGIETTHV